MKKHKKQQHIEAVDKNKEVWMKLTHTQEWILPPAEDLEILENLNPWTIDRFMKMAEKDQEYFIRNDKEYFKEIMLYKTKTQILSFLVFVVINLLATYMVYSWYSWGAVALVISELIVWLVSYIHIDKNRNKNIKDSN